ncbi:ATP-dependent DNA ligase [Candidatus Woesearchaeota archaeon]|nr:ATP-dependent DNA ligase [Candidatus Woesearchaeota archaeon]
MKYSELVGLYGKLDSTTKRLEKTYYLSEFLKKTTADDIEPVILLVQGRVFPSYDERELGVANQLVIKAIGIASGVQSEAIEKEWAKTGDLGKVAEQLIKGKRQATLAATELIVKKVFDNLRKLTELTGQGSVDRKMQLIAELLSSAKGTEARYITRTILGQLRVGTGAGILRDAIAWAYFPKAVEKVFVKCGSCRSTVPQADNCVECGKELSKEAKKAAVTSAAAEGEEKKESAREEYNVILDKIQQAYDLTNDFGVVARKAKTEGAKGLETIEIRIGTPIKVMLALKVDTVEEAFETVGRPAQCEYKYDGFRLECHRQGDKIWLYTRRLENVTNQFPDVVEYIKKHVKGDNYILDAEAVGFDPKNQKYVPFQNISQRIKRKYGIEKMANELPVEVNVFDVLCYEGKNIVSQPFRKRREIIEKIVKNAERKIVVSRAITAEKEAEVEKFFREAKAAGTEGVMIKALDAPYQPGARVGYMLKFKKVMENLDLAIVAAEWGEGKRAKWLSSYYLACRDHGHDKLLEIGKVSTGLKEKREEGLSFDEVTEFLKPLVVEETGRLVKVKPKIVIEVAYEEIQKSPTYESGYALRFPRVIRNRTDEKGIHDINSIEDVERLYRQQKRVKG